MQSPNPSNILNRRGLLMSSLAVGALLVVGPMRCTTVPRLIVQIALPSIVAREATRVSMRAAALRRVRADGDDTGRGIIDRVGRLFVRTGNANRDGARENPAQDKVIDLVENVMEASYGWAIEKAVDDLIPVEDDTPLAFVADGKLLDDLSDFNGEGQAILAEDEAPIKVSFVEWSLYDMDRRDELQIAALSTSMHPGKVQPFSAAKAITIAGSGRKCIIMRVDGEVVSVSEPFLVT